MNLYSSEEPLLLISEELYGTLDGEETFTVFLKDPAIKEDTDPDHGRGNVEFRIAGYYSGKGTELYMPFPAARALAAGSQIILADESCAGKRGIRLNTRGGSVCPLPGVLEQTMSQLSSASAQLGHFFRKLRG